MTKANEEILLQIDRLVLKRLDLLKQYPSLSVEAMQLLEKNDLSAFDMKLDQRSELAGQIDGISNEIAALILRLDHECGLIIASILTTNDQISNCPSWVLNIARSMEQTRTLLRNCVLFDEKLTAFARSVHADIEAKLAGIRVQRKIENSYTENHTTTSGMHIHISTK